MFVNFVALNTSWNLRKMAEMLKGFDALFVDLPIEFEPYLENFEKLQRIATFYTQDLNALEWVISNLDIEVHCYIDNVHAKLKRNTSTQLLNLVLKAKLGKENVEEWKEVIMDDLKSNEKFAEYEAFNIIERAGKKNACLNLNENIEEVLVREGYVVNREQLYDFRRPIDKLYSLVKMEMKGYTVDDEEFKRAIRQHIKFIDTVIELGYEEACKLIWEV